MPGRPFDLLVFDWDGTLMDSVASIVGCIQQAALDLELGEVAEATARRTIGMDLRQAMKALGFTGDEPLWDRLVERYRHHWVTTYRDQHVLFDGAAAMLDALAERGYLLAVATGKSRRGLDRDLASTGLGGRFHATRTSDEACSKPHPQMLFDLNAELGVSPPGALVIGDTTFDLEMAANAGSPAVAVASGSFPAAELLRARPLACLEHVCHLLPWLEERSPRS